MPTLLKKLPNHQVFENEGVFRTPSKQRTKLVLPTLDGIGLFDINKVIFMEANDYMAYLYLEGESRVAINMSFKDLEIQLAGLSFFRIHKSFIVHLAKVSRIVTRQGCLVITENGYQLSVSRARKSELLKRIENL